MEDKNIDSYLRQYSVNSQGVLKIYDLRFKIVTVYIVGLLTSVITSVVFKNWLGFLTGAIGTLIMYGLDKKMHDRQSPIRVCFS